jgi:hypothetical protein
MHALAFEWVTGEALPQLRADPHHPDGVHIDEKPGAPRSCFTVLPYPAPCCGVWIVRCDLCRRLVAITGAALADDPRSARIACQPQRPAADGGSQ